MINIDDVKLLKLAPGQMLVVKVDGVLSSEMVDRIKRAFESNAPMLQDRVLVIDKTVTLAVVDAQAA